MKMQLQHNWLYVKDGWERIRQLTVSNSQLTVFSFDKLKSPGKLNLSGLFYSDVILLR